MSNEIRVGILGAGSMGCNHAESIKEIDGAKISAVCDCNAQSIEKFKEKTQLNDFEEFTDFDAMIDTVELDALYVCLPPFAHNGEVEKAAAKGIHIFLEKPIAMTSDQAQSMVKAIEDNGLTSQVGYQMRFRKSIRKLVEMIADGSAGKPTLFQGRFWCNFAIGTGPTWWHDKTKSGGQILEQIIHIYDLSLYLLGEPKSAYGVMENIVHDDPGYTIEDTSVGVIRFKNGAIASITGSNCTAPVHFIGDFQIVFENVTLDYKSTGQHWVTEDSARLLHKDGKVEEFVEDDNVYLLEDTDFIQAIRESRQATAPARDGLEDIRIIEKIILSADEKKN